MMQPADVPVFVLCGGLGTRLKEETEFRPKPMVPVGNDPILLHLMRLYSAHGFRQFVLCCGFRADVIKDYFLNYASLRSDFSVDLSANKVTLHSVDHKDDWTVTLADTGERTMTGGRVARAAAKYLNGRSEFAVTYGDGLADVDLGKELEFHLSHGKVGTVLGVNPPSRFGELKLSGDQVIEFAEKPKFSDEWINGGFFYFKDRFLDYLIEDESCVLERAPLVKLAQDGELSMYRHTGFWHCMDTQRDRDELNEMWNGGDAPWLRK
jgi:glucose-1-phosphate cytidylyltransferase